MKWFKHDCDAGSDSKIKKLIKKYGLRGYGMYFFTLELMGRKIEYNLDAIGFLPDEWDVEALEIEFGLSPDDIGTMYDYMISIGLFERIGGKLYNEKIKGRCDEYTQKLIRKHDFNQDRERKVGIVSGQTPDTVGRMTDIVPLRIDKNRVEENILNIGASPNLETLKEARNKLADKLSLKKNIGIHTQWQAEAFRIADVLKIKLKPEYKSRWLKLFKDAFLSGNRSSIYLAYGFMSDYPKQLNDEDKIKLFFWKYANPKAEYKNPKS